MALDSREALKSNRPPRTGGISTIGVTTADRPELLERCLWSLTREVSAHARNARIIVVDASKRARNESRARRATAAVGNATDQNIAFVGRTERVAVGRALQQIGDAALIDFALRPGASGNRNIILLLARGENVLFIDDDVVCDVWCRRSLEQAIVFGGHVERRDISFYTRRADVCTSLVRAPIDLIQAHEPVLGRTVASLARSETLAVDTRPACDHIQTGIRQKLPLRVRMTLAGIAGDSGANYPDRLLFSRGTWRTALARSRQAFNTALTSREICKLGNQYIVMHAVSCMAACLGLSNTSITPPFLPVGRNEDGLFGATLLAIDRHGVSCQVPYAVIHASSRPPRYSGRKWPSASETRSADLLMSLVNDASRRVGAKQPQRRLTAIGQALQTLGTLRPQEFVSAMSLVTSQTREMELGVIECALDTPDIYPDYWRRALRSYRRALLAHMPKPSLVLPLEFHSARSVKAGFEGFQQFVRTAGELFVQWPDLWERARTMLRELNL